MISRRNRIASENEFAGDSGLSLQDLMTGFVAPFFLGAIISWLQFDSLSDHWRLLAAAGTGLSIAASVYAGKRHRRANRRYVRAAASRYGLKFSETGNQDLVERIKVTTGQNGEFSLVSVAEGMYQGIDLLVGELVVRAGSGKSQTTTRDIVVYAWDPRLQLPRFAMQTQGKMMSWAAGLVGLHDIDFSDNPKFSERYHLSSQDPGATQKLFQGEPVQLLGESEGWEIRGKDDAVLFCSRNRNSNSVKWLLDDSCRLFECFKTAARRNELWIQSPRDRQAARIQDGTSRRQQRTISPQDYLTRMEGAGIIKWTEAKRFLKTRPPRQVEPRMYRELVSVTGCLALILNFLCVLFIMGGSLLLFLSIPDSGTRNNDWIFGVIIGLSLVAISCLVLFTGYRERSRCQDLLRNGRIAKAFIESLRPAKASSKGSQGYAAEVRYVVGGKRYSEELTLYGTHIDYVRDAMRYQQPVPLLYHPQSPNRIRLAIQLTTSLKVTV